ncbi:tetratricopeptide repeat protein [Candidatus Bipolaricaulota bacterium]|nr:tetratricopeptide repeat protein [Candidatus Bipolaricaulota bacterium]
MNRFFERYKSTIIWVMVIGFFLGSVGLAAFQYMRPGGSSSGKDGSEEEVALVVNGDEVSGTEFNNSYDNLVERQKSLYSQFGQDFSRLLEGASGKLYELRIKSRTADSLIEQSLTRQEAEKKGIKPGSGEVAQKYEEQLNSILEQQGWTLDQLKAALESQGRTYKEFEENMRENIRTQLQREQLRNEVVGSIDPSEEELKTYYQDNIETYVQSPSKVKASQLVFDTQTKAQTIRDKVKTDPSHFDEYLKNNEVDSEVGWFKKGEKEKQLEDLAFSLGVGEVGGPVKTSSGWEVLRIEDKQERVVPELEEIRDKVKEDYVSQEEQTRYDNWYKEVKEKANIEIKLPVVLAYRKAQDDFQAGLEAYQKLKEENSSIDSYLPYYIGRLYEQRISTLKQEEESSEAEGVQEKINDYEQKAVKNYMEVVRETGSSAGDLLNRVVGLDPDNPEANYYLGRYQLQNKQYSMAAQSFQKAIQSRPDYVAAYMDYGKLLVELRNYEEAAEQFKKALDLASDNINIMNNLAHAYMKSKQYGKAEDTYKDVLKLSSNNFNAKKGLGDLYSEQGNYEDAIKYYNDALRVKADDDTSLALGRAYLETGQLEDAKSELESLLRRSPYNSEGYMLLGDYYRRKGLLDRALEEYREGLARTRDRELRIKISKRILEQDPGDTETRFTLAKAYQDQHIYDSAIEQYNKILESTEGLSERWEAIMGLGKAHLKKTNYDQATEYYQEGLELANSSVQRLEIYQGLLKADEGKNGEENLSRVGKEALLRIAEININQGRGSDAKENLERLSNLDPEYRTERVEELLGKVNTSQ